MLKVKEYFRMNIYSYQYYGERLVANFVPVWRPKASNVLKLLNITASKFSDCFCLLSKIYGSPHGMHQEGRKISVIDQNEKLGKL
jgi:hypothetical protein